MDGEREWMMQWMWTMDKKRRAKNYERIKLLFEMTGTIERARILLREAGIRS